MVRLIGHQDQVSEVSHGVWHGVGVSYVFGSLNGPPQRNELVGKIRTFWSFWY